MKTPEILIVDDDPAICDLLSEQLEFDGHFRTSKANTLGQTRDMMSQPSYYNDAILLDITLSDGNGRDFCSELRQKEEYMPIIMVTGNDTEEEIVNCLNAGANDYITKPFRRKELLARLTAQLRIFSNSHNATYKIGPYIFHPGERFLTKDKGKNRILLTDKEAAILKLLYQSGDNGVQRKDILNKIWGCSPSVLTHTLETHIYRLRQKIENDSAATSPLLMTIDGGYCLNPDIPDGAYIT